MKTIIISFIKILFASLTMGIIARVSYGILLDKISENVSLISSIGIGISVYFIIICFMKIEDVDNIIRILKNNPQT